MRGRPTGSSHCEPLRRAHRVDAWFDNVGGDLGDAPLVYARNFSGGVWDSLGFAITALQDGTTYTAALASSLLLSMQAPPTLWGISVFGFLAFVSAFFMGIYLFVGIRRSG